MNADAIKGAIRDQCVAWAVKPAVLDVTSGNRSNWPAAVSYRGMDRNADNASADVWVGNPIHLIPAAFTEHRNVVEIDSSSNPYLLLAQVGRYAPAGEYAIAMTDGMRRTMIRRQGSDFVRWVTRFPGDDCRLIHRWYDDFVRWSLATIPRMKILQALRATVDPTVRGAYFYALRVEFVGPLAGQSVDHPSPTML